MSLLAVPPLTVRRVAQRSLHPFRAETREIITRLFVGPRLASGPLPARPILAGNQQRRFALLPDEILGTVAFKIADEVIAGASVFAGVAQTLVNLFFAVLAFVSQQAFALVLGDHVDAGCVVLALVIFALVDVHGAVVRGVAWFTVALVRFHVVYAGPLVEAVAVVT